MAKLEERVRRHLDAGDVVAAATEVLTELGPEVQRLLRSALEDEAEAGAAFSRFAEELWRELPAQPPRGSLRAWVYRNAWRAALDVKHRTRVLDGAGPPAARQRLRARAQEPAASREPALDGLELSAEEKTLIALGVDQRLSWREIAHALSSPDPARMLERAEPSAAGQRLRTRAQELAASREAALGRVLPSLSADDQVLIVLRLHLRLSWTEIAYVLSPPGRRIPPAAFMERLERLKDRLAELAPTSGLVG